MEDPSVRNSTEVTQFISRCDSIASTLKRQTYPESYYGQVWPADAMLCAASLALHDKLFEPKYAPAMAKWIDNVKSLVDKNGLIPHSIYRDSPADDARGSSQSLMLIFLNEIDPEFARSQYEIYEKLFIDTRFGLTGIREYPAGTFGLGDIDSGPVILQMGGAATIVGLQTTARFGNCETNRRINGTLEALEIDGEVGFIKDALKFSYVILRKDGKTLVPRNPGYHRVVSELREMKREKRVWLCDETGRSEVGRQDKERSLSNAALDQWHRGAVVQVDEIVRKERKGRPAMVGRILSSGVVKVIRPA